MSNQELTEKLHKPIFRNFKKPNVNSSFVGNFWSTDPADMQLISKFNRRVCFFLCVNNVFHKFAWLLSLKDKQGITISNAFQKKVRWV